MNKNSTFRDMVCCLSLLCSDSKHPGRTGLPPRNCRSLGLPLRALTAHVAWHATREALARAGQACRTAVLPPTLRTSRKHTPLRSRWCCRNRLTNRRIRSRRRLTELPLPVKSSHRSRTGLLGSLPLLQEQRLLTFHQTSSSNRRTQGLMILHDHPAANVGLQAPDKLRNSPLLTATDVGRKLLKLHKPGLIIHH